MGNYFQPEIECASQEQIREWQDERLVKQVRHVYDNVEYYRNKMKEKGVITRYEYEKGIKKIPD